MGKYKRDNRSDVYRFGLLLWELSSERAPFQKLDETIYYIKNLLIAFYPFQKFDGAIYYIKNHLIADWILVIDVMKLD